MNTAKTRRGLLRMLSHVQNLYEACERGQLMYDMRKVQHWDPCMALLLLRLAYDSEDPIRVREPERTACRDWLRQVGLFGPDEGKKRKDQLRLKQLSSPNELYDEIELLFGFLTQHEALDARSARKFGPMLSEVLMNTFQHGESARGAMICGQNYRGSRHAMVAAIDWGKTIPVTLSNAHAYRNMSKTDSEWIQFATEPLTTAQSRPENRGMGLAHMCEIIDRSGGTLHVVSRRGFYTRTDGGREILEDLPNPEFQLDGTLVVVDLHSSKT